MQHQEIVFGRAGQVFSFDPPDGRPAPSPVPTVHVIGGGRATTGACSIDPVDTTLYGDAHAGSQQIRVASTEGFAVGVRYLMTKPEGDREWIVVEAIGDDHTLTLKHPLLLRYAGAATIVGCRISIAVDPGWVSNVARRSDTPGRGLAGYMLRWTYTMNGAEHTGVSFADLVGTRSAQVVTPEDLDQRIPGWTANLPEGHRANRGADFIAEAFRAVRLEAVGDEHAQRKIRDTTVLRELATARANVIRLEHEVMYGGPLTEELAIAEQRYRSCYSRLVDLTRGSEPGIRRGIPKLTNH